MASVDAAINILVNGQSQLEKAYQRLTDIEKTVSRLEKTPINLGATGLSQKAGIIDDAYRVLLKDAKQFYDQITVGSRKAVKGTTDLFSATKELASTTAGLRQQAGAFRELAANIGFADKEQSKYFRSFVQGAELARKKGVRAQFEEFRALSELYTSGKTPFGEKFLPGAAPMGRNALQQVIALGSKIPNTTSAIQSYGEELERVIGLVEIGSDAFRTLEEAIASNAQRLRNTRLMGQTSPIQAAAGPATELASVKALRQREAYAKKIDDYNTRQAALQERIEVSRKTGLLTEERSRLLVNKLLDASGDLERGSLDTAKAKTIEIERQRRLLEIITRNEKVSKPAQVFGVKDIAFQDISGRLSSGKAVPGSPAAMQRETTVRLSWQTALSQMEAVAEAVSDTAQSKAAGIQMNWNLAFEKAKDIISDATFKGLQEGTSAAASLGRQRLREIERTTADLWRRSGGPALPPGMVEPGAGVSQQKRALNLLGSAQIAQSKLAALDESTAGVGEERARVEKIINDLKERGNDISRDSLNIADLELTKSKEYLRQLKQASAGGGGGGGVPKESGFAKSFKSFSEGLGDVGGFFGDLSPAQAIDKIVREFNAGLKPKGGAGGVADSVKDSFVTGLKTGIPEGVKAAVTFSKAVIEAFRNAFQAKSPARVIIDRVVIPIVQAFEKLKDFAGRGKSAAEFFAAGVKDELIFGPQELAGPLRKPAVSGALRGVATSELSAEALARRAPVPQGGVVLGPAGATPASQGGIFNPSARRPGLGGVGSAYPNLPAYNLADELSETGRRVTTANDRVREAIKQYRAAVENFWEGQDSEFVSTGKVVASFARLTAARISRRSQQKPDLSIDQQISRELKEAKSALPLGAGVRSQLSSLAERAGEKLDSVFSAISLQVNKYLDRIKSVVASRQPPAPPAQAVESSGFLAASQRFTQITEAARAGAPIPPIPPGGIGRPSAGGPDDFDARLSAAADQGAQALLSLKELQDPAKISSARLEQLAGILKVASDNIAPVGPESKQLINALNKAQVELADVQARRAPDADFLTRRFGERGGRAISEGLIGGAFPLLFGQGLGASILGGAGGAAGGFLGGGLGFGLSLLGTGLGSALDGLSQAAQETGKSLRYPTESFDKLREAGLFASREQEYRISKLIESGRIERAQAEIQAEIVRKIGATGVNDLSRLGDSSSKLSKAWAEFSLRLQAAISGPLAGLLSWVTAIVAAGNQRGRDKARVEDVRAGLTGANREAFDREREAITGLTRRGLLFGGIMPGEAISRELALAERYAPLSKPQQITGLTSQEEQEAALNKSMETADRIRAMNRQGIDLQRSADDLRLSVEDTVYGLRRRAADMEREAAEFRRSVEDQVFAKRQELERKLIENDRNRRQNEIEAFDLQLQRAGAGLDPIAQGIVEAARQYIRVRAEGEAELQKNERELKLTLQQIDQETSRYRLEVENRISQMIIQRDEFSRDVARSKLQVERSIGDYIVRIEEYRIEMAKERVRLAMEEGKIAEAASIARTEGLSAVTPTGRNYAGFGGFQGGRQILHGIPGYAGYDPSHASETNIHYHFAGRNPAETKAVADYLRRLGYQITEFGQYGQRVGRHAPGSQHYREQGFNAFDIPGSSMGGPMSQIVEGQRRVHRLIGDFLNAPGGGSASATTPAPARAQAAAAPSMRQIAPPQPPAVPGFPSAPQLISVNDLLDRYLSLQKQLQAAIVAGNTVLIQRYAIEEDAARLALEQQVLAPIRQFQQQNRELQNEVENRKLRNRLLLEGVAPEIIEGEVRVLELSRNLNSVLQGLEVSTNEQVKAELARLKLNPELINGTFRLTEATLESLIATTQDTKKQEELRKELQRILNLKNALAGKAKVEAGEAQAGARDAAVAQVVPPGERAAEVIGNLKKEIKETLDLVNQAQFIADSVGRAFENAFQGLITGSTSARQALGNFFGAIAQDFASMAAKIIAQQLKMLLINNLLRIFNISIPGAATGAAFGSGASAVAPALSLDFAADGAMFSNNIAKFARGGTFTNSIVSSPTLFKFADGGAMRTGVMGEAGPEAIMPLKRGPDGKLGVLADGAMGQAIAISVNVDAKGTSVQGNDSRGGDLGKAIGAVVQAEIIKQQRPGGLLNR